MTQCDVLRRGGDEGFSGDDHYVGESGKHIEQTWGPEMSTSTRTSSVLVHILSQPLSYLDKVIVRCVRFDDGKRLRCTVVSTFVRRCLKGSLHTPTLGNLIEIFNIEIIYDV
jgi:hypothetical protein